MTARLRRNTQSMGHLFRAARYELGLTQRDVAKAAGTAHSYVANAENGRVDLSPRVLVRVAEVLQLDAAPLLRQRLQERAYRSLPESETP